ncbi:MAG: class I SAM-dependent methyltransferase [Candidatus Methylumidiphilus sp.]
MTEWDATKYAGLSRLQAAMAEEVLSLLAFKGSERVLDVGCGDGKITAEIAARVTRGEVLGVDPSHEMVAFAASHFDPAEWPNLRFDVADARHLPFREAFDCIVSFNALHWVSEQGEALRSLRAAIKPDGLAQLRLVSRGERKSLEEVIEDTRLCSKWANYFEGFQTPFLHLTPIQYKALAERNGWNVRSIRNSDKSWDFQSREGFFAFCEVTFVEWTKRLPDAEKSAFIIDVLDSYQSVAADRPDEKHTFKFYQMDVTIVCQ